MEKLNDVLTPNEMKDVIDQMFNPQVDNQDFMDEDEDEESWKVDNGIDFDGATANNFTAMVEH